MAEAINAATGEMVPATGETLLSVPGELSQVALHLPDNLEYADWENIGRNLGRALEGVMWWIGDWWAYGEHEYGDRIEAVKNIEGLPAYKTCKDAGWIARAVEPSRRRDHLSWSHHREVAPLESGEQDEVLEQAEEEGWSKRQVREEVKRRQKAKEPKPEPLSNYELRAGDFREVLADLDDNSIDFILTDPPYGNDAIPLYTDLAEFAAKKLKPGASLVCYTGQSILPNVLNELDEHLRYWWTLSLDHNHGGQQLPGKWVIAEWKPIVWYVNDHRAGREYVADRVRGTRPDKVAHEWAQGMDEVVYLIEQLTKPGDLVVDPFAGSGSFGRAAANLGRQFIGADLDPESHVGRVA